MLKFIFCLYFAIFIAESRTIYYFYNGKLYPNSKVYHIVREPPKNFNPLFEEKPAVTTTNPYISFTRTKKEGTTDVQCLCNRTLCICETISTADTSITSDASTESSTTSWQRTTNLYTSTVSTTEKCPTCEDNCVIPQYRCSLNMYCPPCYLCSDDEYYIYKICKHLSNLTTSSTTSSRTKVDDVTVSLISANSIVTTEIEIFDTTVQSDNQKRENPETVAVTLPEIPAISTSTSDTTFTSDAFIESFPTSSITTTSEVHSTLTGNSNDTSDTLPSIITAGATILNMLPNYVASTTTTPIANVPDYSNTTNIGKNSTSSFLEESSNPTVTKSIENSFQTTTSTSLNITASFAENSSGYTSSLSEFTTFNATNDAVTSNVSVLEDKITATSGPTYNRSTELTTLAKILGNSVIDNSGSKDLDITVTLSTTESISKLITNTTTTVVDSFNTTMTSMSTVFMSSDRDADVISVTVNAVATSIASIVSDFIRINIRENDSTTTNLNEMTTPFHLVNTNVTYNTTKEQHTPPDNDNSINDEIASTLNSDNSIKEETISSPFSTNLTTTRELITISFQQSKPEKQAETKTDSDISAVIETTTIPMHTEYSTIVRKRTETETALIDLTTDLSTFQSTIHSPTNTNALLNAAATTPPVITATDSIRDDTAKENIHTTSKTISNPVSTKAVTRNSVETTVFNRSDELSITFGDINSSAINITETASTAETSADDSTVFLNRTLKTILNPTTTIPSTVVTETTVTKTDATVENISEENILVIDNTTLTETDSVNIMINTTDSVFNLTSSTVGSTTSTEEVITTDQSIVNNDNSSSKLNVELTKADSTTDSSKLLLNITSTIPIVPSTKDNFTNTANNSKSNETLHETSLTTPELDSISAVSILPSTKASINTEPPLTNRTQEISSNEETITIDEDFGSGETTYSGSGEFTDSGSGEFTYSGSGDDSEVYSGDDDDDDDDEPKKDNMKTTVLNKRQIIYI